jgi:acyl-CoA synthetase (AMP-forming)/AMP-acid ligase II
MSKSDISEIYGDALPKDDSTLWQRFNESVSGHPAAIALAISHQPPGLYGIPNQALEDNQYQQAPYLRWTFKDLRYAASRLSKALKAIGVLPGMPIITFLPNGVEYVLMLWAANEIGCILAPINPRNLSNKVEVTHMINTVASTAPEKKLLIVAGDSHVADQVGSLGGVGNALKFVVGDRNPISNWSSFQELMEYPTDMEDSLVMTNGSTSKSSFEVVLFTSGTTSLPKGCKWDSSTLISILTMRANLAGYMKPGDKWGIVLPNNHAIGFVSLVTSHAFGGAVVFPGATFVPAPMLSILRLEKCTHTSVVPTMVNAMLSVEAIDGTRLDDLKNVFLGGTMITPETLRQCIEELGSSGVENGYGMTEGIIISSGSQSDYKAIVRGDEVSAGWALPGTAFKICAPGQKTALARNKLGEIHHGSPLLCAGYIGKKTDDFYVDAEGRRWFITGDQGFIDETNRVFVTGRYKGSCILHSYDLG